MMTRLLLATLAISLCGCAMRPMTNEEIVKQSQYCMDHGMIADQKGFNYAVVAVVCLPEKVK